MRLRVCTFNEFVRRIAGKCLACYGAGQWGEWLCEAFPEYEIEKHIAYIADQNSELWGKAKKINGISFDIVSPDYLYANATEDTIILISTGVAVTPQVYSQLEARHELNDCDCYIAMNLVIFHEDYHWDRTPSVTQDFSAGSEMRIPKLIHYAWFGENLMPELSKKCIESWRKYCPDYEIIKWDLSNYDFSNNRYMRKAAEAGKWAQLSDCARLDIVYNHGGVYFDIDVELLKNIDELLYNNAYCGFDHTRFVNTGAGLGSVPGLPIIRNLIDEYDNIEFESSLEAGYIYQTKTLSRFGLKRNGGIQSVCGMTIYPCEFFVPKYFYTGKMNITCNTFSIHHATVSWYTDERRSNRDKREELLREAVKNENELVKQLI